MLYQKTCSFLNYSPGENDVNYATKSAFSILIMPILYLHKTAHNRYVNHFVRLACMLRSPFLPVDSLSSLISPLVCPPTFAFFLGFGTLCVMSSPCVFFVESCLFLFLLCSEPGYFISKNKLVGQNFCLI